MNKSLLVLTAVLILTPLFYFLSSFNDSKIISGAPPYYVEDESPPHNLFDEYAYLKNWKRPDGPPRVGLQVGHWKNEEVPDELHRLRGNTGASAGGKDEWEVNMIIAQETQKLLEANGITVDILPATIPENYWADAFVAIHADGSEDISKSGFKAATPRRDLSKKAESLLTIIEDSYQQATGLVKDDNITRNMKGYYAFSYWRYKNALHPMTTALILETGFLTNPSDRLTIVSKPEVSATGLANGLIQFLKTEKILAQTPPK